MKAELPEYCFQLPKAKPVLNWKQHQAGKIFSAQQDSCTISCSCAKQEGARHENKHNQLSIGWAGKGSKAYKEQNMVDSAPLFVNINAPLFRAGQHLTKKDVHLHVACYSCSTLPLLTHLPATSASFKPTRTCLKNRDPKWLSFRFPNEPT